MAAIETKRGFRVITVENQSYRWRVVSGECLTFMVTRSDAGGTTLLVSMPGLEFPGGCSCPACSANAHVVLPSQVADSIRAALDAGWKPAETNKPFCLSVDTTAQCASNAARLQKILEKGR